MSRSVPRRVVWLSALAAAVVAAASLTPAAPAAAAPEAPARAGQSACSLAGRSETRFVWVGPALRAYNLRVPAGMTRAGMLVVSLHPGWALDANTWEPQSGWTALGATNRFVVAYPQGTAGNFWNPNDDTAPDIAFLLAVVADIKARVCIDPARVHIDGYSIGGWMAQRMACHSPGVFASASAGGAGHPEQDDWVFPGDPPASPCAPSRPVSVYVAMGEDDLLATGRRARDGWIADDGCPATAAAQPAPGGRVWFHAPCAAGTEVIWRQFTGLDHIEAVDAYRTTLMERYLFFARNPRP